MLYCALTWGVGARGAGTPGKVKHAAPRRARPAFPQGCLGASAGPQTPRPTKPWPRALFCFAKQWWGQCQRGVTASPQPPGSRAHTSRGGALWRPTPGDHRRTAMEASRVSSSRPSALYCTYVLYCANFETAGRACFVHVGKKVASCQPPKAGQWHSLCRRCGSVRQSNGRRPPERCVWRCGSQRAWTTSRACPTRVL